MITSLIRQVVAQSKGDAIAQLRVLRFLEDLHRDIRESEFQPALPTDRHGLNNLLKEMEAEGGWPYIPKMNLRALLSHETRETYEDRPTRTLEPDPD